MVVLPSSPVWYQSRGIDTSHNGILAFGSRNLVYLLDLNLSRPEIYGILSAHTDKVTSCSFCSAVGQDQLLRLASGADDGSVKVWDVRQKLMLNEHSAHGTNKIISVHWSPVNPALILSGDEKGFVICWDLDQSSTDRFYPDGSSQMNLCSLTCSPHQENIVAIGYKSGAVSLMDIRKNGAVIKKLRGHTNEVHGIVWVPNQDEASLFNEKQDGNEETASLDQTKSGCEGIIISGSKDKSIKIWSLSKGKCIRTLRIPNRVTKGRKVNEDLARLYAAVYWPVESKTKFISSGYNGDVIVWDLDPKAENLFEILASQTHDAGHHRIIFNICRGSKVGNSIITTSMDRQLLHWTIPDQLPSSCPGPDWTLPTLGGFVYAIAVSPKDPSVVAIGVGDGMIRIWKSRSPKSAYDIATLWQGIKEKVMALAWHPTREGLLAFATEDGKVGIYDTLSMRLPTIAETYHLKPVYTLSWGPACAPKTSEGSPKSTVQKFHLYSCGGDGVIYQHDSENMSRDAVSVDSVIESSNPGQHCSLGRHSEVSWSQNGRLLAIGNDNGSIAIFTSPHLRNIVVIKCHSKIVNCVRWRPPADENDSSLEIATGSNNSTIFIHDITKIFNENGYTIGEDIETPILVSKSSKSLIGHLSRITGISYNNRDPAEIVSSSYDSTAQVWNTESERPLFNFRGHYGRLMCVAWTSVIDETNKDKASGIIYTGADDYTVHGWYAQDQQHTEPVKKLPDFGFGPKNVFKSKKKGRQKRGGAGQFSNPNMQNGGTHPLPTTTNNDQTSPDLEVLLEKKKAELLASMNGDIASNDGVGSPKQSQSSVAARFPMDTDRLHCSFQNPIGGQVRSPLNKTLINVCHTKSVPYEEEFPGKRKKRLKNMFPQSVSMDNRKKAIQHEDCVKIVQWKMRDSFNLEDDRDGLPFLPGEPEHINLGFYTDRRAAFRMMKNEAEKLQEDDMSEGSQNIRLWMGDVVGTIKDATEKSQLTDQLVAMAPVAGQQFWRETAHAYAKQLLSEDHPLHAVHYFLICDKVYEAIQILLDSRNYREAVALARARLCDDDPVLKRTIRVWGQKLKNGGSVELAAKCFASIGEFEEAAIALAQRATSGASNITDSDTASLWAATSVAAAANKIECASEFANRALSTVCIRTWNWHENSDVLTTFSNLLPYRFISIMHEILTTRLVARAGLRGLLTMKKSEWNDAVAKSKDDKFPDTVSRFWKLQASELGEKSCAMIHKEAIKHQKDDVTESRALFLLSFSLSAAICSHPVLHNVANQKSSGDNTSSTSAETTDTENQDCSKHWMRHLQNSAIILSKSSFFGPEICREILLIICEVVLWIRSRTDGGILDSNGISEDGVLNENKQCKELGSGDALHENNTDATEVIRSGCKYLLENLQSSDVDLASFYQSFLFVESSITPSAGD